jgi:hypothetical protein
MKFLVGQGLCVAMVMLFGVTDVIAAPPRIPAAALEIEKEPLGRRNSQSRRVSGVDELKLLQAGAGVLQELGFTIEGSETSLGLVVAAKVRDASDRAQKIGAVVLGALTGVDLGVDSVQSVTASLVTRPSLKGNIIVRVMFQRLVYDDRNQISQIEAIDDPEVYREFYARLEKAARVKAHEL